MPQDPTLSHKRIKTSGYANKFTGNVLIGIVL